MKEMKKCQFCGKDFEPTRKTQKFCKDVHTSECLVCGELFNVKKLSRPSKTCSISCAAKIGHTVESKEKRKQNSLEKYGVEHPFQSKEVIYKIKESLDKSENDSRFGSKASRDNISKRYGVDNVSKLNFIKEKKRSSFKNKYGVDNPMKSKEVLESRDKIMREKHNVSSRKYINVNQADDFANLREFLTKNKLSILELCEIFGVKRDKMLREIREQNAQLLVIDYGETKSIKEKEFARFLEMNFPTVEVSMNNRTILKGKEIDFFFPDKRLGVEISPTRTHNSKQGYNGAPGLNHLYHKDKFLSCSEENIELITIFDWHDWNKILEMISNKLSSSQSIYARKTVYSESDRIDDDTFNSVRDWHILSLPSNFKRAQQVSKLTHNGEVVLIAIWSKKGKTAELKRLVSKPGVNIVGGASKVMKNFIENNDIDSLTTYSDCDLGQGNVYSTLGFELIEESKPQLNYYQPYYHVHIRNLSLVMQGADRLLSKFPNYKPVGMGDNLPNNREIVESYGFLPVYDCGYRKWKFDVKKRSVQK